MTNFQDLLYVVWLLVLFQTVRKIPCVGRFEYTKGWNTSFLPVFVIRRYTNKVGFVISWSFWVFMTKGVYKTSTETLMTWLLRHMYVFNFIYNSRIHFLSNVISYLTVILDSKTLEIEIGITFYLFRYWNW